MKMSELKELPLDYWDRQKLFKERLAKIQGTATTIPSYREVVDKLAELEKEHELLGRRYDELTKLLSKDKASERDSFIRNYAKDWK
jgi:hypothetical protein